MNKLGIHQNVKAFMLPKTPLRKWKDIHLKLTWHYKSTILQLKKEKTKKTKENEKTNHKLGEKNVQIIYLIKDLHWEYIKNSYHSMR